VFGCLDAWMFGCPVCLTGETRRPDRSLQGVVVAADKDAGACVLDDGTGLMRVELRVFLRSAPPDAADAHPAVGVASALNRIGWRKDRVSDDLMRCLLPGDYVMAIGPLHKSGDVAQRDSMARMLAHQVVVLNTKQQREPVWFLEVIEYWTAVVADR